MESTGQWSDGTCS